MQSDTTRAWAIRQNSYLLSTRSSNSVGPSPLLDSPTRPIIHRTTRLAVRASGRRAGRARELARFAFRLLPGCGVLDLLQLALLVGQVQGRAVGLPDVAV